MKFVLRLVIVVLVLIVIAVGAAFYYIDTIAKTAVEEGGTYAMGVETKLDKADVKVFSGEFAMSGLHIANPEGFDEDTFLQLSDGGAKVSLPTLANELVELPTLSLNGVRIVLLKKEGKANYRAILDNLKRFESEDQTSKEGKRFNVQRIEIRDVKVESSLLPIGGELTRTTFPIDEIILEDVGSHTEKGMLVGELWDVVLKAIFLGIVNKGTELPGDMLKGLSGSLGDLQGLADLGINVALKSGDEVIGLVGDLGQGVTEAAGKAVEDVGKGLGEAGKTATEGVGEALKGIGEGLGGVLGGKKEKQE